MIWYPPPCTHWPWTLSSTASACYQPSGFKIQEPDATGGIQLGLTWTHAITTLGTCAKCMACSAVCKCADYKFVWPYWASLVWVDISHWVDIPTTFIIFCIMIQLCIVTIMHYSMSHHLEPFVCTFKQNVGCLLMLQYLPRHSCNFWNNSAP